MISVEVNERELQEIIFNMKVDWERYHKEKFHYMGEKAHERLIEKLEEKLKRERHGG